MQARSRVQKSQRRSCSQGCEWERGVDAATNSFSNPESAESWGGSGWISWRVDYDSLGSSAEIVQAHSMTCRVAVVRYKGCQRRVRPHDVSIRRVGSPPDIVMQFHSIGVGGGNPAQRPIVASGLNSPMQNKTLSRSA